MEQGRLPQNWPTDKANLVRGLIFAAIVFGSGLASGSVWLAILVGALLAGLAAGIYLYRSRRPGSQSHVSGDGPRRGD